MTSDVVPKTGYPLIILPIFSGSSSKKPTTLPSSGCLSNSSNSSVPASPAPIIIILLVPYVCFLSFLEYFENQ